MRTPRFKVVCSFDPALDYESMTVSEMTDYLRNRDFSTIEPHLKSGERPTIYHVKQVPHTLWQSYVMAGTEGERPMRAFRCGVERVENLHQEDGPSVTWAARHNGRPHVMTDEELEKFAPSEAEEIGEVIYTHSFLPLRIVDCFRLPPIHD